MEEVGLWLLKETVHTRGGDLWAASGGRVTNLLSKGVFKSEINHLLGFFWFICCFDNAEHFIGVAGLKNVAFEHLPPEIDSGSGRVNLCAMEIP